MTVVMPNFTLLFDDDRRDTPSLPEPLRTVYGGDWRLPEVGERPYIYSNFAVSRDGRVSFNVPGHLGGGDVSAFSAHDRWLMALLRARADAVVVGDHTLRLEPDHLWTCEHIYPHDAGAFADLRTREGRAPSPVQVFLSLDGDLMAEAAVFQRPDLRILIATTARGAERARGVNGAARVEVRELGEDKVDLKRLVQVLYEDFGVCTLLCEGGPRAYGGFVAAGLVDEEFLTLCPTVIGNPANSAGPRPGLIEGIAFAPDAYPKSVPVSLRRAGEHLFLKSRYIFP